MKSEQYQEFKLICSQEPPDGGTQRWERTGRGNGQEAYAKEKARWPKAEITIFTRDVVMTHSEWKTKVPDNQCSGSLYSHKAHGQCSGYATDRT